jgi:ABC-type transport system involved in multi-copper enzyme maturation permease subunit
MLGWGVVLLSAAILLHIYRPRLFGPVLLYDGIRSARRSDFALLRSAYAIGLLIMLFVVYSDWIPIQGASLWQTLWTPGAVPIKNLARFGESFFFMFAGVQFVAVVLLTPVIAAGAITEEKQGRTLESVLATDLRDGEIIWGKVASRIGYLLLFGLTGLPVLCFLQYVGGVDPNLVLANFAATAVTVVSLASVSVYCSVVAPTTQVAVAMTYLVAVLYGLVSAGCAFIRVPWLTFGNIGVAYFRISQSGTAVFLPTVLAEYVLIHSLITVRCCWAAAAQAAAAQLRGSARQTARSVSDKIPSLDTNGEDPPFPRPAWKEAPRHPPIGGHPILWKELYVHSAYRGNHRAWIVSRIAEVFVIVALYLILVLLVTPTSISHPIQTNLDNRLTGLPVAAVTCIMLIITAMHAARAINSERTRGTLESLLITPLDSWTILWEKWLGSILTGGGGGWWALAAFWALGQATGMIHPVSALLLVLAWVVYAAYAAALGLLFSLYLVSTVRAALSTLAVIICFAAGPSVLWAGVTMLWYRAGPPPPGVAWAREFLFYGLTPPLTLSQLAFSWEDVHRPRLLYALAGLGCYAVLAAALGALLVIRFGPVTGRMPLRRSKTVVPG